jgi:CheY-like chemotaxis protein
VYGIVRQWGGFLTFESRTGEGSRFSVYLPRTFENVSERGSDVALSALAHGSETVLLVEDEEMVRRLAREILTIRGYHVLEAANGDAALAVCAARSGQIDILVTDLVMPGMSGRDLAEALVGRYPSLKRLYMSGYTENVFARHEMPEGTAFIQKPFSGGALAAKVREVLDR